jgi:alpha-galactosidase
VDEGWLKSRAANGSIVEDFVKFPSGMKGFGDWVHSQCFADNQCMKYGLYTCRGSCQCSTPWYSGPGSLGYEAQDAQWMADAGADYVKEDSCCGSQDQPTAFAEYGLMRDSLNKTGRPIYFSLCGWEVWYAPVGDTLGNSWRIAGDGSGWGPLTNCMNTMAGITQYAGPGTYIHTCGLDT